MYKFTHTSLLKNDGIKTKKWPTTKKKKRKSNHPIYLKKKNHV